jgi:transposase InsO family protein
VQEDQTLVEAQICELQSQDPFIQSKDWCAHPSIQIEDEDMKGHWTMDSKGLVRKDRLVYIPNDPAVRAEVMRVNHDDPWTGGHFGQIKTFRTISRCYWWPGLRKHTDEYVETCDICQRMKIPRHKPYGLLAPLPQPERPWQDISMDFIVDLPRSRWRGRDYDSIFVVVDRYSKFVRFIPCNKTITAEQLADLLMEEIVARYGAPRSIVSDQGSIFTSKYWSTFCYQLCIQRRLSTSFHPQTDGQTERMNQTLECYLRCYINYEQDDWTSLLASAQFAMNNAVNETTKEAPATLVYTFRPSLPFNVEPDNLVSENADARIRTGRLAAIREKLTATWQKSQDAVKKWYDKHRKEKAFGEGDMVMLSSKNINLTRVNKKLADKLIGPFKIEKKIGRNAYKLTLPKKYGRLHPVFHVSLLEGYRQRPGIIPPEPIDVEGEEEWEVERILAVRGKGKKKKWLVRWRGFSEADDTWEPREHLTNAKEMIAEYERKFQS